MPSSLTVLQRWLSTEPAVLLRTILRGRTPSPSVMRRHGWWLILIFFVPTVVLDARAIALRKTEEEEKDSERQRDKRRHKLDRIIVAVRGRPVVDSRLSGSKSEEEQLEPKRVYARFEALATPLLLAYTPAEASAERTEGTESSSVGVKWELVNDSVKACYRFEKKSPRMVAGVVVLAQTLLRELAEATEKTDAAQEERYLDGEELESAYTKVTIASLHPDSEKLESVACASLICFRLGYCSYVSLQKFKKLRLDVASSPGG